MTVFHSSPVANPHPLRPQELALGRSERSKKPAIELRDFVDVEKMIAYVARKRVAAEPVIHEQPVVDYSTLITAWEMFLNDTLGDCTCASVAHGNMIFAALVGKAFGVTNADILRMYEHSGYVPGKPETDQGWTLEAAAEFDRTIGLLGTPESPQPGIVASAGVSVTDDDAQQVAMELFGGLSSGCEVPESAVSEFQEGKPWTVVKGSPIVGGHAIWKAKNELRKSGLFVTWGALQQAEEAWEKEYIDEYLAFVPVDWESKLPEELLKAGVVDFAKLQSLVNQYSN